MKNRSQNLDRSLAVLSHPLAVLAFILYLANTFFLQRIAPSWWTGKISDFTWLFFFPLVLCVPLSLLIPRKYPDQQTKVIYIAIALCGIPFALLKSSPPLLSFVSGTFKNWSRMNLDLASDPSDLLALISLLGAALFWNHHYPARIASNKFAYLLAASSILFTLADSAGPDMGIRTLALQNGHLFACSSYVVYQSEDGGMDWDQIQSTPQDKCTYEDISNPVVDPSNVNIQYKYVDVDEIHRSQDAGNTWTLDYSWKPVSNAAQVYLQIRQPTEYYAFYPLYAVHEPQSGNTVFAMGSQGILVRQQNGQYAWRQVGAFGKIDTEPVTVLQEFIWRDAYFGFLLGCLLVSLLVLKIVHPQFRVFFIYFLLAAWLVEVATLTPNVLSSYGDPDSLHALGCEVISVPTILFFIASLIVAGHYQRRFLFRVLLYFGLIILTFPLPYALWALGLHNSYFAAFLFALFIEIAIAILFFRKLQDEFPAALDAAQSNANKP